LRDDNNEVRWLAGEALVALERRAILPVLRALEMHFDSIFLRHGAYHVLHVLERENTLSERTMAVLDSLRSSDPGITIAWNAHKAVEFLKRSAPSLPGAMETPATKYFPR
jgi:hypothetical protein